MNKDFGILGGVTPRTLKYLSILKKEKLLPKLIFIYGYNFDKNLFNKIKSLCKNLFFFKSKFASNRDIINFINKKNLDFIIYSDILVKYLR